MTISKVWLQKQFQSSGIQTESAALKLLAERMQEMPSNSEELLGSLLDDIETRTEDRKLTLSFLKEFLDKSCGTLSGNVELVDAFKVPLIQYDPIRHMFHMNTKGRSIVGDIKNKFQLYEDRFLMIQQRLKRNAMFRPTKWGRLSKQGDVAELTELKSLLGHERERKFVIGFLTKHEEGQYYIEDLSARLPIDLTVCNTADGLFTENCVVVAEGELMPGGDFRAIALGLPPAESREESIEALQGHDLFGASRPGYEPEKSEEEDDGDRIVFLSDVHLDDPKVLENLDAIFQGYSLPEATMPTAFVLMGNFQKTNANGPRSSLSKIKDNFTMLGRLIAKHPSILSNSDIILVPGPHDIGIGNMLPQRGIPTSVAQGLLQHVPKATLASNPLRMRYRGSDLIFFRSNLQQLLRGLSILPPPMPSFSEDGDDYMRHTAFFFDQTCSTVIQESHLCPVPLDYQPIIWEWDHSLYIYPNPHGLILADSEPAAECVFDTCHCLNPGPLASGSFGAWNPSERVMELCHVNEPEEEEEEEEEEEGAPVVKDSIDATKDTRPVKKHAHIDGYFKAPETTDAHENANTPSEENADMDEDFIVREDSHNAPLESTRTATPKADAIDVDTSQVENDNPTQPEMEEQPSVKADESKIAAPTEDETHQPSDDAMDAL